MQQRRLRPIFLSFVLAAAPTLGLDVPQVSADQTFTPPPGSYNGRKVYLSPANHVPQNPPGCDGYEENAGARAIATKVKDYLYSRGYAVRIGSGGSVANVNSSNAWGSTVHIPIHSNVFDKDCSAPFNTQNGGSWLMFKPGSTAGSNLAQRIFDAIKASSPGTWDLKNTDEVLSGAQLHELRATNMPSAYVETGFHTYRPDVDWLRLTTTVGNKIGLGIDNHLGNPRCPCPEFVPMADLTTSTSVEHARPYVQVSVADARRSPTLEAAYRVVLARITGARFGGATEGLLHGVWLTADGVAIVDLADVRGRVPNVTTTYGLRLLTSRLNAAGFGDQSVQAIEYRIDGSCETFWSWADAMCYLVRR